MQITKEFLIDKLLKETGGILYDIDIKESLATAEEYHGFQCGKISMLRELIELSNATNYQKE